MNAGGIASGMFDMIGALDKYKVSQSLAKEQKKRAEELRNEANQVKAPALRREYRDVLKMKNLGTLSGMPGYEQYREEIAQDAANQLQAGKDAASSGADYLSYATAINSAANKEARGMKVQDTTARAGALADYGNTLWNVGTEQVKNEDIKRMDQKDILARSASLEDAATANEAQGKTDAIGGLVAAGGAMAGSFGGGSGGRGVSGGSSRNPGESVTPVQAATYNMPDAQPAGRTASANGVAKFDSRSMMKYGLTMAEMDEVNALAGKYPNASMEQIIRLYKQNKSVH